jgi:hypothetical protein
MCVVIKGESGQNWMCVVIKGESGQNWMCVVIKGESGQNWMCVEHILQKKVGGGVDSGGRQLATVVMTVHDITLILTVAVELRVEFVNEGAGRPTGSIGYIT